MSTVITAHAIIGLKVPDVDIFKPHLVKTFDHNYPESFKFNPEDGNPLWNTEHRAVEFFNEIDYTIENYKVMEHEESSHNLFVILTRIEMSMSSRIESAGIDLPSPEETKQFKECMEKHGLWKDGNFKMWMTYTYS